MIIDKDIVKMLLEEKIKDIPLTNGLYQISSKGYIISYREDPRGKMYYGTPNDDGYYVFNVINQFDESKTEYVHKLVASAFVPNDNPINKVEVHHKDRQKWNNDYRSLQWVSWEEHKKIHQELREKQKLEGQNNGQQ